MHPRIPRIRAHLAIAWCVGLSSIVGCDRSYVVKEPRVISGTHANVAAYALETSPGIVPFRAGTTVLVGAAEETKLRGATLAPAGTSPCQGSREFTLVYEDGAPQPQGPLDLTGGHSLKFYFMSEDASRGPLVGASAVDLALDTSAGRQCIRVPIATSESGSPEWQMAPSSAGLLAADGFRLFPLRPATTSSVAPAWTLFTRLGATFGPTRLWVEFSGGPAASSGYGDLIATAGGDRLVWELGRWAIGFGAAYDAVWNLATQPKSSMRYFLHGPRITPSVSFLPLRLRSSETGLPFGRRTFFVELELPASLWFGTGDAPSVVPAIGAGLHLGIGI